MTTAYTSLLGLALPVTGELSGTWGDTVNNSITSLLDSAVAGTTNVSTDGDVTLTTTTGAANTAREAILLFSGARTALRTVTAPAQSKVYTVINATTGGFSVKLVGAGPTTGVTILAGESAVCAWNGSDFIKVSNSSGAGVFTSITNTGLTSGRVVYSTTGGLETDSANLTFNGTTLTAGGLTTTGTTSTGVLSVTGNTTLGDAAADNVTVNGTVTSNLIFTDNTYDIGASGATRPRNLFLAGNATIGGSIAATTLDLTNLEVTNIKAKDGTASITIADSTGAVSFANNVTLGDASTDTVTVNGYMGVGGAAAASTALTVASTALTSTQQFGVSGQITGTSAATSLVVGVDAYPQTANASFTTTNVAGFYARAGLKGASNTASNWHGVYIADQTQGTNNYGVTSAVSSGSNKFNIYASGTAQNYFAGNVGVKVSAPSESLSVACSSTTDNAFNPAIVVGPSGTGTQGGFIGSRTASANQLQGLYVRSNQTLTLWGDATGDGDLVLEVVSGASPSASTSANALLQLFATGSFVTLPAAGGAAVFNENGVDADFRVESDTNTHMLFVDAGNNVVNIGSSSLTGGDLNVNDVIRVSGAAPEIRIDVGSSGYYFGLSEEYSGDRAISRLNSVAGAGFSGQFQFEANSAAGAFRELARMDYANGSIFNEDGEDIDFRVESDTNTYALFVDAGSNAIGIGTSATTAGWSGYFPLVIGAAPLNLASTGASSTFSQIVHAGYYNGSNWIQTYTDVTVARIEFIGTPAGATQNFYTASNVTAGTAVTSLRNLSLTPSASVFNEDSNDIDFRIESDNNGSAFVVDAGLDQVIVGSNSGISGSTNNIPLVVRYSSGPATRFYSNVSATQIATTGISLTTYGDSRYAGYQTTGGGGLWTNSSNGTTTFITSPTTGGIVRIGNFNQDPFENTSVAFVEYAQLNSSETVFNDESRDIDFRVESDASTHMLFVNAGNNRVGINQSTPLASLDVGDSEIRQGGITTAVRTASNSTGAAIFLSQFGDVPITGWIHAVETGTSKYLILACYKESSAAAVTTTTLASNGLGVQATNSGGTVTLNGYTNANNVKMVAYVIGTTGAD